MAFVSHIVRRRGSVPFAAVLLATTAFAACCTAYAKPRRAASPEADAGCAYLPASNAVRSTVGATTLQPTQATATGGTVKVQVLGVAIPFTSFGIIHRLQTVSGVASVQFNLKKGEAILKLKPGAYVTNEMLRDAVRDASYSPGKIEWPSKQVQEAHANAQNCQISSEARKVG